MKKLDVFNMLCIIILFLFLLFIAFTLRFILNKRIQDREDSVNTEKIDKKDHNGAIEDYNEEIRLNPKYASTYNNRGYVKAKKGDYDGAIEDFDEAIKINPNYAKAYNNRGYVKKRNNDISGAIKDYKKAIKLNPKLKTKEITVFLDSKKLNIGFLDYVKIWLIVILLIQFLFKKGIFMKNNNSLVILKLENGFQIETKIGFSGRALFFGFFEPFFRGDFFWGILHLLITFFSLVSMAYYGKLDISLFWILFPLFYNKIYIIKLLKKGYAPADENSKKILIEQGWIKG